MFRPSSACSPPHKPNLKAKISIGEDTNRVHVWSIEGEQLGLPTSFKNLNVAANIAVRSVWCTSSMWGLIYQTEDLMICESDCEKLCPFLTMMLDLKEHEPEEDDGMNSK